MKRKISSCCWRVLSSPTCPSIQFRRSFVTIQRGPVEKLLTPEELPVQYWPQLPKRLRPDHTNREIIVHEPPPQDWQKCKEPLKLIDEQQLARLDPTGARSKLFDPLNPDRARPGDILHTTFTSGEPFSGIIMTIKGSGPHKSVLLRNHLTRLGVEMSIKVHSPLVQSMEVAQRSTKRRKRGRLYFLRKPEHDIGSVQKIVDQYLRERAMLTGRKAGRSTTTRLQQKKKR